MLCQSVLWKIYFYFRKVYKTKIYGYLLCMESQTKSLSAKDKTSLESKQTKLANCRTMLSYIQTTLLFICVIIVTYLLDGRNFNWVCITMAVFAGIVLLAGVVHYLAIDQYIKGINNEN